MLQRILYSKVLASEVLKADLYRYSGDLGFSAFKKAFRNTGFHFTPVLQAELFIKQIFYFGTLCPNAIP